MEKCIRTLINLMDYLFLRLWLVRLSLGHKMWGVDFRVRHIKQAPSRYLIAILQHLEAEVSNTVTLKAGLTFDNIESGLAKLQIAENAYIGPGVFLDLAAPILIAAEAVLAPEVMILTHGDVGDRLLSKFMERSVGPVTLKKGCWIGARAIILSGITVGEGAVIGAGAVVTADVPDFTVVAGVPAREIRKVKN